MEDEVEVRMVSTISHCIQWYKSVVAKSGGDEVLVEHAVAFIFQPVLGSSPSLCNDL